MCELHSYSDKVHRNYDPTHTIALRAAFVRDFNIRFTLLIRVIRKSVGDNDCFGIAPKVHSLQMTPARAGQFAFRRSTDKISEFMKWLDQQVKEGIITVKELEQIGNSVEAAWFNKYILDSYKRGILRARAEMRGIGMNIPSLEETGGVDMALASGFHMDRVGLLYSRIYTDLKGVTESMDAVISRILSQGMIDGDDPRLLARKLVAAIDGQGIDTLGLRDALGRYISPMRRAEMIARTEIIRAHHLATIQEYRNWGLENIIVKGEWKTAGDDRVCPLCASMDGKVFTLDEIEGMIPAHVQCRCIALPWIEELQKYF